MGQLLAESIALSVVSGVVGTLLAVAAIRAIRAYGPANLARLDRVSLDLRALAWAVAVSMIVGVLVGLAPAVTVWWRRARLASEEGARGSSAGPAARGVRRTLVVAEIALAIVLSHCGRLQQNFGDGSTYLTPTQILNPRVAKFNVTVNY